jgi:exocyst complex component 4
VPTFQTRKPVSAYFAYFCATSAQSFAVPVAEYDRVEAGFNTRSQTSPDNAQVYHSKLTKFLNDLALKPNDPPHDLGEQNLRNNENGAIPSGRSSNLVSSAVFNPEADSFTYMETLIESLAVLGKLGTALDVISQRLSNEVFTLVETTINEVEERAEFGRRFSVFGGTLPQSEDIYVFTNGESLGGIEYAIPDTTRLIDPSGLRLAALEAHTKYTDQEILRDFFWTLYSKLDAVIQGFRVISEVANRVGSVRASYFSSFSPFLTLIVIAARF